MQGKNMTFWSICLREVTFVNFLYILAHTRWLSHHASISCAKVASHGCKMTFERYIRGNSCRFSSFGQGTSERQHLTPKSSCEMDARWLFDSHLASILHDPMSPPQHQSYHVRWTWDDFSILISRDHASPTPHQSYHTRWTWDDFSILTSRPSCMPQCQDVSSTHKSHLA